MSCLPSSMLEELLRHKLGKSRRGTTLSEHTADLLEKAEMWDQEIVCLSLLLARLLEKGLIANSSELNQIYELSNEIYFRVEEFGEGFLSFLMKHRRNEILSLEDDLIEKQELLGKYDFDKALCC